VTVAGTVTFNAVGQSGRLTASAALSDGSTRDVTAEARWGSSDTSITVSAAGVVTVAHFGRSTVFATYQTKTGTVTVNATPDGTFVLNGRAREPGLSGVTGVTVRETASGAVTLTDGEGFFTLASMTSAHLAFEKQGFESVALEASSTAFENVAMQRVLRLAAGASLDLELAPHDMDYTPTSNSRCYPCRMIRVTVTQPGRLTIHATSTEKQARLNLWLAQNVYVGGAPDVTAEVPSIGAGEILLYVGMPGVDPQYYTPVSVVTQFTPASVSRVR
jgi:hypothetical protein